MVTVQAYDDADFDVEADAAAFERMIGHYAALSAVAFRELRCVKDIAYGPAPEQRLDIFLPPSKPVGNTIVFFHGGWWRAGTKEARAFLASPFVNAGSVFVNVEYPLAPAAKLADIVASAAAAVAWVHRNIGRYEGRASLTLCGNSAGAHLAACVASRRTLDGIGVRHGAVRRLIGLSGLYDLAPLMPLFPRNWIDFTDQLVEDLSPVRRTYAPDLQVALYAGDREPRGFHDQTLGFAAILRERGHALRCGLLDGEDHLSIIARLPEIVLSDDARARG